MQKVYNNPNNPSVFSGLDVRDFPWDRIEGAILRWGRPPPPEWIIRLGQTSPDNYPL